VIGTYGPGTVLVLAPELDVNAARELGERLSTGSESTSRFIGIAMYPAAATSAQELVSQAMQACLRATAAVPVIVAESLLAESERPKPVNQGSGIYSSQPMLEIRAMLQKLAERKLPVLILGETGTGKELAAHELHVAGPRRNGPLRVINCAAIPENLVESALFGHERGAFTGADRARAGIFEDARGGTVFLDEVGELSRSAQAALLRVLETHKITRVGATREIDIDVRVVAATHRDLEKMAAEGSFRLDLLHRLNVVTVILPPLRERREDIAPLVNFFLKQASAEWGGSARSIDPAALELLEQYTWPGNVRELRNVIARAAAVADGELITVRDLPERLCSAPRPEMRTGRPQAPTETMDLRGHLRQVERDLIMGALERTQGNQRSAAELLGLPLRTFERRLSALKEDGEDE
jgi:DNA-binding NtrC family response regulator